MAGRDKMLAVDLPAAEHYEDVELLGRGGMGAVYRARDSVRGRWVALKRLLIDAETKHREERIALFHREYRTLAELKHPRVIEVFDYGIDGQGPFYTMELLDGADLSSRAPVPWQLACSLVRDVCSSLALLHSRGFVHRDVSPLNVRCTDDGRAKLIDFGAMTPMGISTLTMGTPPCVAPEALGRQPLDGRTDLFALGATFYFTLTGRQAYPARTLTQLRALHERAPRPPSAYVADIPPALDRLVLSLLSIDPMARPRHAAEVMDRLTILAELAPLEQGAVHQSYLNTPALVGRDAASKELSELLRKVMSGTGAVLRLRAAEGGGRSRMLHASVMDARLAGALVLQVGCAAAGVSAFGVMRALLADLRDSADNARATLARRPALRPLLADEAGPIDEPSARETILKDLASLFVEQSRMQPLVIAIDDIDRCDEPSLAALLTLASLVRRSPIELLYSDASAEIPGALSLLHELSHTVELPPLDQDQTEALLGSVFGQVPNLASVASYVFERAVGNPRATMELSQALVDRGLARYELGSWSLPGRLASDALPSSHLDARRAKLAGLSADARELAQLLAIIAGNAMGLDELYALTDHQDAIRTSAAHAELLDSRVVEPRDAQVLADRSWQQIVRQSIDDARLRTVYQRLSQLLVTRGAKPLQIASCLLRAGEEVRALDVLCPALLKGSLVDDADSDYPELLQEAASCCTRLGRPPRDCFMIHRELVALADRVIVKGLDVHFHSALARLSADSGLDDWLALEGQVADDVRLVQALTRVQARYDALPERERVLSPLDAVKGLVETVYAGAVYAAVIGDRVLLDSLPPLAPFEPLSPAIAAINEAIKAQRMLIGALYEDSLELYVVRLDALEAGANATTLTAAQIERSRLLLNYALGALRAGLGIKGALDNAKRLDELPHGQVLAASVRENYCVRRGNTRGAEQWRRQRELLQIQQKRPHALKLRQATQQIECSAHAEDLEETKRNLQLLEELSEIYPSATPYVHYARAEYQRLRGDYSAGLRHVRVALAATKPGMHPVWPWAAGCEIECLRLLNRLEAAREVGDRHVRDAAQAGMRVMRDHIETFLALVEGQLGDFQAATQRLDRGIEYREFYGMYGLNLGWSYEARAQVSLWMKDRESFERCLRSCAEHYQGGRDNPALAARYEQLMQAARATWKGMEYIDMAAEGPLSTIAQSINTNLQERTLMLHTLVGCKDRDERARMVLQQLLTTSNCNDGQLYLLRDGGVSLVAGSKGTPEMQALVERLLGIDEDAAENTVTGDDESELSTTAVQMFEFKPMLLTCFRDQEIATVGVVALRSQRPEASGNFLATARELSAALIDLGDVKPKLG
jgi:tetratricopeptide (TPR) repeat protein